METTKDAVRVEREQGPPSRAGGRWVPSNECSEVLVALAQARSCGLDWFVNEDGRGWVWRADINGDPNDRRAREQRDRKTYVREGWNRDDKMLKAVALMALAGNATDCFLRKTPKGWALYIHRPDRDG